MTTEADAIVAADHISAFRTPPPFHFRLQKALNTVLFDKQQIFYHAHVIKSAVPLIECFQATTWEIAALIAKADKPLAQQVAIFAHVGTVLAAWPAAGTIRLVKTILFQVIMHCQVVGTYTTVHSAGSNKFFSHIMQSIKK
jgi:hypothetical protein